MAFHAIAKSTPGQVIDLPTPPDHIVIDVKSQAGTQWPKHLNLAPDSNFIRIPIGLTSSEEQNFDLAKLIFIRVRYVHADPINFIS